MTKKIIGWSGGTDSTYTLVKELEKPGGNETVLALTIRTSDKSASHVAALSGATRRLHTILTQRYGPFEWIVMDFRGSHGLGANGDAYELEQEAAAAIVALSLGGHPQVLWSCCEEDNEVASHDHDKLVSAVGEPLYVNRGIRKSEMRTHLADLWDMTVSCNDPRSDLVPCGRCEKCKERHL